MREFWVVWVAGKPLDGKHTPARTFDSLAAALGEAQRLRREVTEREVYVLAPTHRLDGIGLTHVLDGAACHRQPMATIVRRKRGRLVITTPE